MHGPEPLLSVEDAQWLENLAAESIGWQPLGEGAYLHVGDPRALESDAVVIDIVGVPDAGMSEWNNRGQTTVYWW